MRKPTDIDEAELDAYSAEYVQKMQQKAAEDIAEAAEDDDAEEIVGKSPPFPVAAFPMPIRDAIADIVKGKGVDPGMAGAFFLALASACIGRARMIRYSPTWIEAANLYILVTAETGEGKSHTQRFIFKELSRMEAIAKRQYQEDRRKYEEAMILFRKSHQGRTKRGESTASADPLQEMPKRPVNVQYMLDDSTIEAAVELLFDNPRGLVWLVDEFHGFFQSLDRYSGAKGGVSEGKRKLLSAFDGRSIAMSRKAKDGVSNEIYVENATLSICGCIQTKLLPEIFSHIDKSQGSPQRFLFVRCPPQPQLLHPIPDIPESAGRLISKITKHLLALDMQEDPDGRIVGAQVGMTDDARRAFDIFCNCLGEKTHGTAMAGFGAKLKSQSLRLALIMHCLRQACEGDVVDRDVTYGDMSAGLQIADYFYAQAQAINAMIPDSACVKASIVLDHERTLATMLTKYEDQIIAQANMVDAKTLHRWMNAEKIKISDKELNKILDKLGTRRGKTQRGRHRLFLPDVFVKCRKLAMMAVRIWDETEPDKSLDSTE
jgi:hypothetical protein